MSPILIVAAAVAAAVLVAVLIAVAVAFGPAQRARALQKRIEAREVREYEVHEKLKEHTKEFRRVLQCFRRGSCHKSGDPFPLLPEVL